MEQIRFYRVRGEKYGCFSNFSWHSFILRNKKWTTSEHYFQAMKFVDTEYEECVRLCSTPKAAADMGRDRRLPLRKDWEIAKDGVMFDAVLAKFSQNADIRKMLLDTGNAILIEDSPIDDYWGCGKDGTGRNQLGVTLMQVREYLRNYQHMNVNVYRYMSDPVFHRIVDLRAQELSREVIDQSVIIARELEMHGICLLRKLDGQIRMIDPDRYQLAECIREPNLLGELGIEGVPGKDRDDEC